MTEIKDPNNEAGAVAPAAPCSASSVRLYEITAIISRSVVIAATSKEEALAHVETWEQAWETSSELIGVSDVDLMDVRDMKTDDWEDEAHEATQQALSLLNVKAVAAAAWMPVFKEERCRRLPPATCWAGFFGEGNPLVIYDPYADQTLRHDIIAEIYGSSSSAHDGMMAELEFEVVQIPVAAGLVDHS